MNEHSSNKKDADRLVERAKQFHTSGDIAIAIESLREATALYAAKDTAATIESVSIIVSRAGACRLCGEYLFETGAFAEAANMFQEAVNQYSRLDSEEAEGIVRRLAHRVIECVDVLKSRPGERLHLLIAQYEHRQLQYAALPSHEYEQAQCAEHIARILHRRERPDEAVARYSEAIRLYTSANELPNTMLRIAECHERVGNILSNRPGASDRAKYHFKEAIVLYKLFEPKVSGETVRFERCKTNLNHLEASR